MIKKNKILSAAFIMLLILFVLPIFAQQNTETVGPILDESMKDQNGFFTTFVRTPFILFCFVGTLTGVMFSAFFEFVYNIFYGFDGGYPNTKIIWNLGWNQILDSWYWKPGIWWHVVISVIIWSPLLRRKKKED